jgi:hypothetical protein
MTRVSMGRLSSQLLARDPRRVQVVVFDTGFHRLQPLRKGQAPRVALIKQSQGRGTQRPAAALALLLNIVADRDLDHFDGSLHQAHAVFAFAHQHRGHAVEPGCDQVEHILLARKDFGHRFIVLGPAVQKAAHLL